MKWVTSKIFTSKSLSKQQRFPATTENASNEFIALPNLPAIPEHNQDEDVPTRRQSQEENQTFRYEISCNEIDCRKFKKIKSLIRCTRDTT